MAQYHKELVINKPDYFGGGKWNLKSLNHINILLGKNGSGKSLLLRGISQKLSPSSCYYVVPERTGEIAPNPNILVELMSPDGRRNRSTRGNYLADYRNQVISLIQGYFTKRGTKSRDKLINPKNDPVNLLEALNIIIPDFKVKVIDVNPFFELTRIKDESKITSVSNLSSGESQLLTLGIDILTTSGIWELDDQNERVLLIDEPDAHIHPDLQVKFADFLNTIVNEYNVQIIVATHSTTLLSSLGQFGGDKVSIFYINTDKNELYSSVVDDVTKELSSILGGY